MTMSNLTCSKYIYRSKWVNRFWLVKALSCVVDDGKNYHVNSWFKSQKQSVDWLWPLFLMIWNFRRLVVYLSVITWAIWDTAQWKQLMVYFPFEETSSLHFWQLKPSTLSIDWSLWDMSLQMVNSCKQKALWYGNTASCLKICIYYIYA